MDRKPLPFIIMISRGRIRAHFLCFLFVVSLSHTIYGQSLDDLALATTILPPDITGDIANNQPAAAVNKTSSSPSSTTTTTTTTTATAITDLIVDASNHFRDGQCKNDTHCEQPNQFCRLDSNHTDAVGECACSTGFLGENCDRISDCSMCTNKSRCKKSTNGTVSCVCRNGKSIDHLKFRLI